MSNIRRARGRTDKEQVIDWLKSDLKYYKNHIGEVTEYGTTIDNKLITAVETRIKELTNRF
tara:strand:+ start:10 stop:192 length:183 start_codon:yes stop_codon:yes gene_type:complete